MNKLKNYVIPDKLKADIFGLGFENIKSSVGVNVESWRHVDDATQCCFAQVLFNSSNNNLWTTSGGADPPLAAPLRGIHNHHKRALCDLCHVAADRSNFAGRNPVNVIKLNKIERNLVRMRLNLCISLTLSGSNHQKYYLLNCTSVNTFLYFCRSKVKYFERTKLINRK